MDCSLPGSSVHGVSQARILGWVAISSPENLPNPGIEPTSPALEMVSHSAGRFFTTELPDDRVIISFSKEREDVWGCGNNIKSRAILHPRLESWTRWHPGLSPHQPRAGHFDLVELPAQAEIKLGMCVQETEHSWKGTVKFIGSNLELNESGHVILFLPLTSKDGLIGYI